MEESAEEGYRLQKKELRKQKGWWSKRIKTLLNPIEVDLEQILRQSILSRQNASREKKKGPAWRQN